MFIEFFDGKCPIKFANSTTQILLTPEQILAVENRDLLTAKRIGLNTDIYMSLIDPDYPVIVSG
jgi:hypothetical protein